MTGSRASGTKIEEAGILDKDKCLEIIQEIFSTNRYVIHSGIIIDEVGCGWAKLHMTIDPDVHINLTGFTHGGALATLIDNIFGVTCRTIGAEVVTQSITTNLIRNTDIGKTVYAEAHIHHAGRTTIVLEADVFTEEKKLMAHSIATMFVSGTDDRFPRKWDED